MIREERQFTVDLAVIGSGLAGFAASIFAINRGIRTAQIGNTGAVAYTTGYLDLFGRLESDQLLDDPWRGLQQLAASQPQHPLARVTEAEVRTAFSEFVAFLTEAGVPYAPPGERNVMALTPAGTIKPTLCVPSTMQAGVDALAKQARCLIIDFRGLRGFSARQLVANLRSQWPQLWAEQLVFPGMEHGELYPEVMARTLEVPERREELAVAIRAVLGDAEAVGLPAILGMHHPHLVLAEMERLVGRPLFEIPTMPPAVPGIRLREMFEQVFPARGLTLIPQQKVAAVDFAGDAIRLSLADSYGPIAISAQTVILATGRFLSGGLLASFDGISEPLIGLPVTQPDSRDHWFREQYMDKEGHPVHTAGLATDRDFRPLTAGGAPYDRRLFAAGLILAHQDWIRGRCGAGIALASAFRAVDAVGEILARRDGQAGKHQSAEGRRDV